MTKAAAEIREGDVLIVNDRVVYTVRQAIIDVGKGVVQAKVQYTTDGGTEWREWDLDSTVPLTTPK